MTGLLVNIDVGDVRAATEFYTRAFELTVGRRLGPSIVELTGAASPIYLLQASDGSAPFEGAAATRSYRRHWTPVHLDFVFDDLDAALSRAVAAGAVLERGPRLQSWGKSALVADPWGNGLCLIEFVGRGYDEIATG